MPAITREYLISNYFYSHELQSAFKPMAEMLVFSGEFANNTPFGFRYPSSSN